MAIYDYTALDSVGHKVKGTMLANDKQQAYKQLADRKYRPIKIRKSFIALCRCGDLEDLLTLFMHIEFQLKCGVSIDNALLSFLEFYGNKTFNAYLVDALEVLQRGGQVSDALEKHQDVFGATIVGLLRSAEETGNMQEAISNILSFLKLKSEWKRKVRNALIYPVFLTVVACLVLVLSICILGPQVTSLYCEMGQVAEVPWITHFAINILPDAVSYIMCTICFVAVLCVMMRKKYSIAKLLLHVPRVGKLFSKSALWNLFQILHITLKAKVEFVHGLELARDSIGVYKDDVQNIIQLVKDGYGISEAFAQSKVIPRNLIVTIYVGEGGNNLAQCFGYISENLYSDLLYEIDSFGRWLGAGLTIFTGLVFVFILYSLLYPIYSYVEIIGG